MKLPQSNGHVQKFSLRDDPWPKDYTSICEPDWISTSFIPISIALSPSYTDATVCHCLPLLATACHCLSLLATASSEAHNALQCQRCGQAGDAKPVLQKCHRILFFFYCNIFCDDQQYAQMVCVHHRFEDQHPCVDLEAWSIPFLY